MHWANLKYAITNKIIQISYLIVIGLPIIIELFNDLKVKLHLDQLLFNVYYGGACLLLVYVLYGIYAPYPIKTNKDVNDYIKNEMPRYMIYNPDKWVNNVIAYLSETEIAQRDEILMLKDLADKEQNPEAKARLFGQLKLKVSPLYPGCIDRMLQLHWNNFNHSKKRVRLFCTGLFFLACIFAAIAFGERIYIVIDQNLKQ